jgi:hypothetical protein
MSLLLAVAVLWNAWIQAAANPTAERVQVTVHRVDGTSNTGAYEVYFDPHAVELFLAIGPLRIEADHRGIWAAHRNDPTTIARLTTTPFTELNDLFSVLRPTTLPAASLALLQGTDPATRWIPSPLTGPVRWTSARLDARPADPELQPAIQLMGHSTSGRVVARLSGGRLQHMRVTPLLHQPAQTGISSIEVTIQPLAADRPAPIQRDAHVVRSIASLQPLGPPLTQFGRMPPDFTVFTEAGPSLLNELPWDPASNFRVMLLIRQHEQDALKTALQTAYQAMRLTRDALARSAVQTGKPVVQIDPMLVVDVRGTVNAAEAAKTFAQTLAPGSTFAGVYTMLEQRTVIERLAPRAPAVAVILDKSGTIRGVLPWQDLLNENEPDAFAIGLTERLLSESARGR